MKLIKPSFEIIEQKPGMQGLYEQIELAARNCYKSEGLIKYDEEGNSTTAKEFVDKVVNVYKHQSVAEHGTVYLRCPIREEVDGHSHIIDKVNPLKHYANNRYSKYAEVAIRKGWNSDDAFVTTNYRVLLENNWLDDLKYMCEPTEYHEKRITVRFITDRGIMAELTRHRSGSFSVESTRYCNYSSKKFGNELTFIIPSWLDIPEGLAYWHDGINYRVGATEENYYMGIPVRPSQFENAKEIDSFLDILDEASNKYLFLLREFKWTPQQARQVLPHALKTEVIMTGFISDWKHFFSLRDNEKAHPDMIALAKPLHEEFIKRGYLSETV